MKVIIVSDRSGGHIFPALVLTRKIKSKGWRPFLYSNSLLSKYLSKEEGVTWIGKRSLKRSLIVGLFVQLCEAIYFIIKINPNVVIGLGGRDTVFFILMAKLLGKITCIYEPNRVMGKANQFLSFFSSKVYLGLKEPTKDKEKRIGLPIREDILFYEKKKARRILGLDEDTFTIFFLGGSQGSHFINMLAQRVNKEVERSFQIIHIVGYREYPVFREYYSKINKRKVYFQDFFKDMGILYSASDLVISRGGAITLGEINFFQLPAIVIPYPYAYKHQYNNAKFFEDRGCVLVFCEDNFNWNIFARTIESFIDNQDRLETFRKNIEKTRVYTDEESFCRSIFS